MADKRFVLDTSAIMAVLQDEPETARVVDLVDMAGSGQATVLVPFLALMETEYLLLRRLDRERAANTLAILHSWPVSVTESTEDWRHEAARIKAVGSLSVADAWMAALATLSDAQLIHKDDEFDGVAGLRSLKLA